ncbi:MAG: GNAT family N-acetyltransferase [Desulfovibrio sp.]|jgi:ribosomal protein S18 acetylase RimI-like enzyme|nr:GNAT family N-acetyltransferase [Desulfovibrio sp.]
MTAGCAERAPFHDEAELLAGIINAAGEGVVSWLLDGIVPGIDGLTVFAATLMRDDAAYNLGNMLLLEEGGKAQALLFSYPAALHRIHPAMSGFVKAAKIDAARPMLERSVPGSLYVNTFWVAADRRGTGTADLLMQRAQAKAREAGLQGISLFCRHSNPRALRFYQRRGFETMEQFPFPVPSIEGGGQGGSLLFRSNG